MNRAVFFVFYVAILSALLAHGACRSHPEHETGNEGTSVTVTFADEILYRKRISTSGRLAPFAELKLSFKTGGVIDNIPVKEGQLVTKGDILAALNLSEIRAHLKQSELMYEKASRDYGRTGNLYADTVATLEQLQNAKTAFEIAGSAKEIARFNLDHSTIYAPANGQILKIIAEGNEIIAPGSPVLLFAASQEKWFLKVAVTDRDIVHVNKGDEAEVRFDAYPDEVFEARVAEIPGMADPYTGAFEISLALSSQGRRLMTGFIGKASIITSNISSYVKIPPEALVKAHGREGVVFKYENGKAVRAKVIIEEIYDRNLLVKGEIKKGDTIVAGGAGYIRDGEKLFIYKP